MFEYEKKIPITAEEYELLTRTAEKNGTIYKQTNFYYDTDNYDMNKKKITFRIREKNGKYTAIKKEHNYQDGTCNVETMINISNKYDDSFFIEKGLNFHGSLETERVDICRDSNLNVVVDKNSYLDCMDYEIEIEYSYNEEIYAQKYLAYFEYLLCDVYKTATHDDFRKRLKNLESKSERFFKKLQSTS